MEHERAGKMAEQRLIDANDLITEIKKFKHERKSGGLFKISWINTMCDIFVLIVEKIKTVDAVPVVRCKNCRFNNTEKKCLHKDSIIKVPADNDYCSYGEPR